MAGKSFYDGNIQFCSDRIDFDVWWNVTDELLKEKKKLDTDDVIIKCLEGMINKYPEHKKVLLEQIKLQKIKISKDRDYITRHSGELKVIKGGLYCK
jgi:hypothetical protein